MATYVFEADLDLVKRLEKAEKERTDRLIGLSKYICEQQKLILKKEELSTTQKIHKTIQEQTNNFYFNELSNLINKSVGGVSRDLQSPVLEKN